MQHSINDLRTSISLLKLGSRTPCLTSDYLDSKKITRRYINKRFRFKLREPSGSLQERVYRDIVKLLEVCEVDISRVKHFEGIYSGAWQVCDNISLLFRSVEAVCSRSRVPLYPGKVKGRGINAVRILNRFNKLYVLEGMIDDS